MGVRNGGHISITALGYMEIVPNRTRVALLPIIQRHVHPGTIIWSDEWAGYRNVASLPNVSSHSTVNHFCGTHWHPHTKRGVVLEPGENQVEEDERMSCSPDALVFG